MKCYGVLVAVSLSLLFRAAPQMSAAEPASSDVPGLKSPWDPISAYGERTIEGWRVLVNGKLQTNEGLCVRTHRLLEVQLYQIARVLPPEPLAQLRQIPIWVELAHPRHPCMCYHESPDWLREHDMNPEKAGAVEIANATNFLSWTREQPWMVLHELAHGYHHRFLKHDHPGIRQCYERAVASKSYESVLRINGRKDRAYALNNEKEYFAELTEAFLGVNDFYPFVRAEVKAHDPGMFLVLEAVWGARRR